MCVNCSATMLKSVWFLKRVTQWCSGTLKFSDSARLLSCTVEGATVPPSDSGVTAGQAVRLWAEHFTLHGISEPLLSSQYIVAHVLGEKSMECVKRLRLRDVLTDQQRENVWKLCQKRLTSMPVQYVIEEWDFRDLTLKMRPPVFIPRPETEELVSLVLEDAMWGEQTDLRCLEVGCGSGAIALSLLHAVPQLRVFALDRSQSAVRLTMENASRLGLQDRLDVRCLDVLTDVDAMLSECGRVDLVVSNPPYLLSQDMASLQTEILRFEDPAALDGGADGLSVIWPILTSASKLLSEHGRIYLEVEPRHAAVLQRLIEEKIPGLNYLETRCDLTHRPRFCIIEKKECKS